MRLKKLTDAFYRENTHLIEALDLVKGSWIKGKTRGYGIVVITFNGLRFGVPLRSNINHDAAYLTVRTSRYNPSNKGLDFSKALLIKTESYISADNFSIPNSEHDKLKGKEHFITSRFEKYVEKYVAAVSNGDKNVLGSREYVFTTLQNYHTELGIRSPSSVPI
ncbi:MAG: hypothetical protein DM484_08255 [Candidatus Methylumidiphilus alinenensis]|uniref:Uncharacterized protein n=1 Tax=Candidatus Methylumidiphilus alinenensis TaxID=2202197 RepID=A0A2W4TFW4_9GAMM|nr:MAG: hypothetical protein DM484_08255 [Candidatus Methylumidiphilus alinenensis]